MRQDRLVGFFVCGFVLMGLAGASGQTWGRPDLPRSGVCFYEHPDFGGRYFCASTGESTAMVPSRMNDKISSIRVLGETEVTVFKDRDFRGDFRTFDRDMGDLRGVGFNDRISSFRVDSRGEWSGSHGGRRREMSWGHPETPRSGACFYENPNFGGRYFCGGVGDSTEMVPPGMNDRISSIRIFGRAEVTVFKDRDFRGDSRRFHRDMRDLRAAGFNDRITSFRVDRRESSYNRR